MKCFNFVTVHLHKNYIHCIIFHTSISFFFFLVSLLRLLFFECLEEHKFNVKNNII